LQKLYRQAKIQEAVARHNATVNTCETKLKQTAKITLKCCGMFQDGFILISTFIHVLYHVTFVLSATSTCTGARQQKIIACSYHEQLTKPASVFRRQISELFSLLLQSTNSKIRSWSHIANHLVLVVGRLQWQVGNLFKKPKTQSFQIGSGWNLRSGK